MEVEETKANLLRLGLSTKDGRSFVIDVSGGVYLEVYPSREGVEVVICEDGYYPGEGGRLDIDTVTTIEQLEALVRVICRA